MDVLISVGTNASYAYSLISMVHHRFQVRVRYARSLRVLPC